MAEARSRQSKTEPGPKRGELAQRPALLLAVLTVLVLAPFLGKPFNVDDPLFIWIARHIQSHPANPYGFSLNWYGYDSPVWTITKNPPLACYYISLVAGLFGWSELALHGAFLVPAVAVILGTHRLAGRLCNRPVHAALLTLFTPVFLVSATTVMCDVSMLAFWVWSLVFWIEGAELKNPWRVAVAAILITLASLTKYFGVCLIPLVVAWSIARKQPLKQWIGWLIVPVIALVAYHVATTALYGHGLLADAAKYPGAVQQSSIVSTAGSLVTGLAFTGGCLATAAFFAPILWRRRELLVGTVVSIALGGALCLVARNSFSTALNALQVAQVLFWTVAGVSVLSLAVADVYQRRNADSVLLVCWVAGTFVFATFLNWVINGRSILPMAIPAAILVMRRLEQRAKDPVKLSQSAFVVPTIAGAVLAIWVAVGDYFFALAPQTAAQTVCGAYLNDGHRLWFQGHWGFQYYMEKGGATALDLQRLNRDAGDLKTGDYIAMPSHNSNVYPLKEPVVQKETISVQIPGGITTMNPESGSGFYASSWGPLPFAIGSGTAQTVDVFVYDPSLKGN